MHSKELEDSITQSETTAETSENASPSEGSKKKSTQIAAENIATQIEKFEDMPSKTLPKKLTSEEVKKMEAALKKLGSGSNNQLTIARVKCLYLKLHKVSARKEMSHPKIIPLKYCILMCVPLYLIFRPI